MLPSGMRLIVLLRDPFQAPLFIAHVNLRDPRCLLVAKGSNTPPIWRDSHVGPHSHQGNSVPSSISIGCRASKFLFVKETSQNVVE